MEREFRTKLNKDDKHSVTTKATIDWSGVSREELEELAAATVVINQQAIYRTSGVIPTADVIKVREQLDRPRGGGFKPTPENMAARIVKMPEEDYRKTLLALGLSDHEVNKMVKTKYPQQKAA